MRYRTLGGTGIEVSAHCLGAMMFGAVGNPDHDDSIRIIHAALDRGINFVDTADMYSTGESEEIVGKALKGRRDDVVLATKVHFPLEDGTRNRSGNSRRWITRAVEDSLRRLGTEWIDLYQIHRPDHTTDVEETLWVLSDLVTAGKIRAFGCSAFPAEDIVQAWHVSERRGYGRFRTDQPPYSMISRGIERSVLPTCQRLGMGVLSYSPLAWGFLSGKIRRDQVDLTTGRAALAPQRFDPSLPANAAKYDAVEQLMEVAEGIDVSLPELALAFVTTHPAVTSVILGPRTMDQLEGLLKAADLTLDDKTLDSIDEIVPPGTDLYQADAAWQPRSLTDPALRRRPLSER